MYIRSTNGAMDVLVARLGVYHGQFDCCICEFVTGSKTFFIVLINKGSALAEPLFVLHLFPFLLLSAPWKRCGHGSSRIF